MLGKEIRLKRLIPGEDGKYFGLTVDHAIARGVMPGLDTIDDTLKKWSPEALTLSRCTKVSLKNALRAMLVKFPLC